MASAATLPATAVPMPSTPQPVAASAPAAPSPAGTATRTVRAHTPQIHWHGKSPIFALDFHPKNVRLLATAGVEPDGLGGLHMWIVHDGAGEGPVEGQPPVSPVTFLQALEGHEKPINCVRFSPNGEFLASAGVEGYIAVWKRAMAAPTPAAALAGAERWEHHAILRSHVLDVADLAWSPSSLFLASGSMDNTCTIFNVFSKQDKVAATIREHSHFVLGVAWDPQDEYVLTNSSDRSSRVHSSPSGRWKNDCKTSFIASKMDFVRGASRFDSQSPEKVIEINDEKKKKNESQHFKLFLDDSLAAHRRRPAWSPDGLFCLVPGGVFQSSVTAAPTHVSHIFARRCVKEPICYLPSGKQPAIAARFCPVLFKMCGGAEGQQEGQHTEADPSNKAASPAPEEGSARGTGGVQADSEKGLPTPSRLFEGQRNANSSILNTTYRLIFAVATQDSVLVYDSSCLEKPYLYVTGIHFTPLTDMSWSADGHFLLTSSSDGYVTIIEFGQGEFGEPLDENDVPLAARPKLTSQQQIAAAAAAMEEVVAEQAAAAAVAAATESASSTNSKKRRIIPSIFKHPDAAAPILVKDAPVATDDAASPVKNDNAEVPAAEAQADAAAGESSKSDEGRKKRRIVPVVVTQGEQLAAAPPAAP